MSEEEIFAEEVDGTEGDVHPEEDLVKSWFVSAWTSVAQYGWFLLGGGLIAIFVWQKLSLYIQQWLRKREEAAQYSLEKKNVDEIVAQQEAMILARRKMQEEYDAKAAEYAEKIKEREEAKRQEKISEWEKHKLGRGYHSKMRVSEQQEATPVLGSARKEKKAALRPEYNPLMGGASGSSFRPCRRGPSGGG